MTINIINPLDREDLTFGEKYTLNQKLKKVLKPDSFVYIQPVVNGIKPDFVIFDKHTGITIIEVKDWSDDFIESADRRMVVCAGSTYRNPLLQVGGYVTAIKSRLQDALEYLDDEGQCSIPVRAMVFFPNLSQAAGQSFTPAFDSDKVAVFYKGSLRNYGASNFYSSDKQLFSADEIHLLRSVVFPEIRIPSKNTIDAQQFLNLSDIRALDKEQEEFAKRVPNGHYMVTGLPGSGKTVMLLTRAIHQAQMFSDWEILIVTYTKALANKLNFQLRQKLAEMNLPASLTHRIEIITFHKLCHNIVGTVNRPDQISDDEYYHQYWPQKAWQALQSDQLFTQYNSVLIDEYQDFHASWFELCRAVCRKTDDNKENLFIAGDRLQLIYNVPWTSYKEIGIQVQGRSKLLKKPYRTHPTHMDFALGFLAKDEVLAKDITNFYELESVSHELALGSYVELLSGSQDMVKKYLHDLLFVTAAYADEMEVSLMESRKKLAERVEELGGMKKSKEGSARSTKSVESYVNKSKPVTLSFDVVM